MDVQLNLWSSLHNKIDVCKSNHYPVHLKLLQCCMSIISQNWKKQTNKQKKKKNHQNIWERIWRTEVGRLPGVFFSKGSHNCICNAYFDLENWCQLAVDHLDSSGEKKGVGREEIHNTNISEKSAFKKFKNKYERILWWQKLRQGLSANVLSMRCILRALIARERRRGGLVGK